MRTKPEHVRVWFGAKELEVCEIDFRVGAADGVHADEGGQVAWDRLEDYLTTLA